VNLPFTIPDIPVRYRRPLLYVGYTAFAFAVAVLTLYGTIPRDRVKDRLEAALSADPGPMNPLGTGMDVTIGDLGITLFTGPGVHGTDGIFKTRPLDTSAKPNKWFVDDATVHISLLGLAFNRPSYTWKGHALKGTITGYWSAKPEMARLGIGLDEVVLNGVQAVQQALMGLPLEAKLDGKLDIEMPKQMLADGSGRIDLVADDIVLGDGKAKLAVPSDPFLAAGLTFPKVRLGKLEGHITIEHGRLRFDDVRMHSADADVTLEGYVELHDPLSTSMLHGYLRFRPSEALAKREPTVELLTNAVSRAKRADGFLGFSLTGSMAMPSLLPSTEPPPGVVSRAGAAPAAPTAVTVPPPPPPGSGPAHAVAPPPETPPAAPPEPPPPPPVAAPVLPPPPPAPPAPTGATGSSVADEKEPPQPPNLRPPVRLLRQPPPTEEKPEAPAETPKSE
jgi:type II secretion system protein N